MDKSRSATGNAQPVPARPSTRPLVNDIRTLRFLHGEMTQGELGERVGVTRQTIASIEAGKYAPSLEVAFGIAEVFGKGVDEVFRRAPA